MLAAEGLARRGVGRPAAGDRLLVVEHKLLEALLGSGPDEDRSIEVVAGHAVVHALVAIVAVAEGLHLANDLEMVDGEEGRAIGDNALVGAHLPEGRLDELADHHAAGEGVGLMIMSGVRPVSVKGMSLCWSIRATMLLPVHTGFL